MTERPINELFAEIVRWGGSRGAKNINQLPGLWIDTTERVGDFGPVTVKMNGHSEELDGIAPFNAVIEHKGWPVAMVNPYGGAVMGSDGTHEDILIAHFKAQPPPR